MGTKLGSLRECLARPVPFALLSCKVAEAFWMAQTSDAGSTEPGHFRFANALTIAFGNLALFLDTESR